jgi:uncharacterized protein (TIGR02246 family)
VGDSQAIAAVIAGLERGFNANDPELVVSGFAADAVVVDARGGVVAGREALLEASGPRSGRISTRATRSRT